jgi:TRAP-type C4-dicarboxylate transport system permease small subunit
MNFITYLLILSASILITYIIFKITENSILYFESLSWAGDKWFLYTGLSITVILLSIHFVKKIRSFINNRNNYER